MESFRHAGVFAKILEEHWPEFWPTRDPKKRNQEIAFRDFLKRRKLVDVAGESEIACEVPYGPQSIDYALLASPAKGKSLSNILATCEVKGPARQTLWQFARNWYDRDGVFGLLPDLKKQLERARAYPRIEHYCAWVVTLNNQRTKSKRDFESSLNTLLARAHEDLGLAQGSVVTVSTHRFQNLGPGELVLFVWRVRS